MSVHCPHATTSIQTLGELVVEHGLDDGSVRVAVDAARDCGWTWQQIGTVLGLPAWAASERFGPGAVGAP